MQDFQTALWQVLTALSSKMVRILVGSGLILNMGCGADTTASSLSREKDRQRVITQSLSNEYAKLEGTYQTDASVDQSPYFIKSQIEVIEVQVDGAMVPSPRLEGVFVITPKAHPDVVDINLQTFPFSNGVFDSQQFSAKVPAFGVDSINVTCEVSSDLMSLFCKWRPSTSAARFDFVLKRIAEDAKKPKF